MKRPSFQFYPADWLSDPNVIAMTPAQRGGYIQLLALMWNTENCALRNDDDFLSKLCGLTGEDLRVVQGCFNQHPTDSALLVHKRLIAEREKQDEWREKSSNGGKKSAEKRLAQAKSKGGSRVVQPKGNTSSPSSTSIYTPLPPKGGDEEEKKMEAEGQMVKWFSGMDSVSNPTALAKKYLQKHKAGVIIKALRNSSCTDLAEFGRLLEHYEKK